MGLFSRRPLTAIEVIDREMIRLHDELDSFTNGCLDKDNYKECYLKIAEQLGAINQAFIKHLGSEQNVNTTSKEETDTKKESCC